MRVALIFPNYLDTFFMVSASAHPPLGLAMIATMVQEAGHEVMVIDATAERLNTHRLLEKIEKFSPDIIGITTMVSFARRAVVTGKWIKARLNDIPVIYGGPWATVEFKEILSSGAGDYVAIGEGEHTVVELLSCLKRGESLHEVKGLAFLHEGEIITTPPRPYCENLDALPFPNWSLFPKPRHYFFDSKGTTFYPIMTSRGCPLGCIHCTKKIHGYKIRYKSVERVIAEIAFLHGRFHADEIIIADDNFNHDIDRAEEICDGIMKLDFKIHLRFSNGIRADKLTPRLAWKLKQAGAYDIALGIESGNQQIVYKIGKNLDLDTVRRATSILKKLNIISRGFFMIGLPHENIHTLVDTKRFALELDLDIAHFYKVIPFTGTRMHDIIRKKGTLLDNFNAGKNYYSLNDAVFEFEGLPKELVELAREDIHRSFYFRWSKIIGLLGKLRLFKNFRWLLNALFRVILNAFKGTGTDSSKGTRESILTRLREMGKKAPIT
ncbi:radical SAM protein [Candidatus Bathyarchaeota archaeon]|nr:radical SAM protein [Candidatus Bathyarchaeota archaeon]